MDAWKKKKKEDKDDGIVVRNFSIYALTNIDDKLYYYAGLV